MREKVLFFAPGTLSIVGIGIHCCEFSGGVVGVATGANALSVRAALTSAGATLFPPLHSPSLISSALAAALSAFGVTTTDTCYSAAQKVVSATGFALADPDYLLI